MTPPKDANSPTTCPHGVDRSRLGCIECGDLPPTRGAPPRTHRELRKVLANRRATRAELGDALLEALLLLAHLESTQPQEPA